MPSISNDKRVLLPVLLFLGIDAGQLVEQPLHWSEDLFQQSQASLLVGIEHAQQVDAHRLGDGGQGHQKHQKLNPTRQSHVLHRASTSLAGPGPATAASSGRTRARLSENFRAKQRKKQVDEKAQRHDSHNDVFHRSDPIEGIGIGDGQGEKADYRQDVNEVHHEPVLLESWRWVAAVPLISGRGDATPRPGGERPKSIMRAANTEFLQLAFLLMTCGELTILPSALHLALCPTRLHFARSGRGQSTLY